MRMDHPAGSYYSEFSQATWFAPNGAIHALWTDSTHPNEVIALDAQTGRLARSLLRSGDVPSGHPWRSVTFTSSDGQEVQGWLALPDGEGPFPTILNMHGGPHIAVPNVFSPTDQIWPDHGFAFLTINYRGSTSFGRQFQEKIWGDIGHWELEDMAAARRFLIEQGIARPDAILLNGASYGGFLTLLGLGRQPDLWAGGLALVAVADWLLDYEGASDALKGAARAWFGGPPEEKRQQYIASSPMTYAEAVRAPLLIIQGRNDTRTPARQMEQYEAKMKALGKDMQVLWFDAGHSGGDMGQIVGFLGQMVQFAQKVVNQ
jgi:dipeptidyl aminopeptidase/acylaminoacyl peptidase